MSPDEIEEDYNGISATELAAESYLQNIYDDDDDISEDDLGRF